VTLIGFPGEESFEDEALDFEADMIDNLKELQKAWVSKDSIDFRLEFIAYGSFDDEFLRAMSVDFRKCRWCIWQNGWDLWHWR